MTVIVHFVEWKMLICILVTFFAICECQRVTKKVLITADDEKLRDPEGYEAIAQLHHQMDDDQSGSIDRFESTDFLKEDMQLGGSDRAQRERAFHHNNDELITVDDLWEAWFASEERSWTTTDLVNWLENTVRLPQYTAAFIGMEIDGRALPRMAIANSTYLSDLGIKNPVHKQKLRLKALDVVLFGFGVGSASRLKDIALSVLVIILVTVLCVLKMQRTRSHMQMEQLTAKLSQLKSMQSHFEDVQQKFEEEQKRRHSSRDAPESEQVETLKSQLMEAERLLENSGWAPLALQPLLKRTCELEMSYVGQQRMECIAEMREAIEHIDKLRRKQTSIVSSIKLATGASSGTDHIDSRIFSLKARMEKISLAMSECHQRWVEIESLCGFPLVIAPANSEMGFPAAVTTGVLPRTGSANSFYRNSDVVAAATVTASLASSSTSGNSPPAVMGTSNRVTPPGCLCTHETFTPTTVQHLNSTTSTHVHKRHHENVTGSKPVRFTVANGELLQHSASSGSLNKFQHLRSATTEMQHCRNQSLNFQATTDAATTSVASTVDEINAPVNSSSPATTAPVVDRILPFKQDLKLLKRTVSNALFGTSPSNIKENGFVEKPQKLDDILLSSNNKKSKFPNLFRKIPKL